MRTHVSKSFILTGYDIETEELLRGVPAVDLAYAAGVIDGEGCISAHNYGVTRLGVRVCVVNTNFMLLRWLRDHLGLGSIRLQSKPKSQRHKQAYKFVVDNRFQVHGLLRAILPYLVIKRPQAIELMELIKLRVGQGLHISPEVTAGVNRFRVLNAKGVAE